MSKEVRLNTTHFFTMKAPNKIELQQIALKHSSNIDFKDFMKIYKKKILQNYILFWLMIQLYRQIIH